MNYFEWEKVRQKKKISLKEKNIKIEIKGERDEHAFSFSDCKLWNDLCKFKCDCEGDPPVVDPPKFSSKSEGSGR